MGVGPLKQFIEEDLWLTRHCLAERLEFFHIGVETFLHELGKEWKYEVWMAHELAPLQLRHSVDARMKLSTSQSHCCR